MEIRISVDDATFAPELMRRLEGLFDTSSVSFDRVRNEVKVESEWGSRAVATLVELVGAWADANGAASATLSLGDRSQTVIGSAPIRAIS